MINAFAAGFQVRPAFQRISEIGGRSGYWRLFFTQLQEEALKKDEKQTTPDDTTETQPAPIVKSTKPRRKVRRATQDVEPIRLPNFRLRAVAPVRTVSDSLAELPELPGVTAYSLSAFKTASIIVHTKQKRRRARRRAAALLLLAA